VRRQKDAKTYVEDIKEDFGLFRNLGFAPADMDRMEKELGI
jgi:hypothetical protein